MKFKFLFLFLFLFFISCSSKNNELLVDINSFKNQGKQIFFKDSIEDSKEIFKISSINLDNKINNNSINSKNYSFNEFKLNKYGSFSHNKYNNYQKKILVLKNYLYFVDDNGLLNILSLLGKNKKKIQIYPKKQVKGYAVKFYIIENNNYVYIADSLGGIHAYDTINSKIKWKFNLGVPFLSNLVFYKNNLYISNVNGKIFSFSALDGNQNWSYETGSGYIKTENAFKISIKNDILIFSNNLKDLTCIDLQNKRLLWTKSLLPYKIVSNQDFFEFSDIIINQKNLIIFTSDNNLFNLDLYTGDINWKKDLSFSKKIQDNNDYLLFVGLDGFFKILNKKNNTVIFSLNLKKYINDKNNKKFLEINNILTINKNIFLTTTDGDFYKISTQNLKNVYYKKITKNISSNIIIYDKFLYFTGDYKYLYSLN